MGRNSQRRRAAKLRKQQDRRRLTGARNPQPSAPDPTPAPDPNWHERTPTGPSGPSYSSRPMPAPDRHLDQRLADAAATGLASGWSAADLIHINSRQSARLGRLTALLFATDADGKDVVAPPPFVEPWWVAEGVDERIATQEATMLSAFFAPQMPVPPRRRVTTARPTTDVLAKVRALLAKAEGTTFAAEAEAFTAKAQELMSRHAIDEAMVAASSDLSDADRAMSVGRVHLEDPYLSQKADLLHVIARANTARSVLHGKLGIATIVGAAHDIDMVELLFTSLLLQATVAMQEAGRVAATDRTRGFRASFLESFAIRIGERLKEAKRAATEDGERTYGSALVPVLAAQEDRVDAALGELFPRLQHRTVSRTIDGRGWDAGRRAADRADVGARRRIAS